MGRPSKIQEAAHRLFLSYAQNEASKLVTEQVTRSLADIWKSQRNVELATGKLLLSWEGIPRESDLWRDTMFRALSGIDSAGNRAHRAIGELVADGLVDANTADRARTLIGVLFTPNTIYASIAPDDAGATFYWRASDMSIEIDIYPTEGYWWRVRNVAMENYSGHGPELPITELKHSLTWLSKEVDRVNPHWRTQPI